MRPPRLAGRRSGFTLIEMLVALTLTAIIGAAITALFVTQERAFDSQTKLQAAREVTRGARNLITSELRMLDRDSGVVSAAADEIVLRVPYALGTACGPGGGGLVVNVLPVDSAMFAQAVYAGYAVRDFVTGRYHYVAKSGNYGTGSPNVCIAALVDTVPNGTTITVTPAVAAEPGAPVLLWQRVRYHFDPSVQVPGTTALYRALPDSTVDEEVVAPFASTAHFEFYVDASNTPVTAPPAPLSSLTGFELVLEGLSERPRADGTRAVVPVRTAVFFKNRRS